MLPSATPGKKDVNLLIGITGSVAAVGIVGHLLGLGQIGNIKVIMTKSAERFIPAESVSLGCDVVVTEDSPTARGGAHIQLAKWASLFVVMPASAHVLGCAAAGLAPSILTSAILAADPGVIFVPNMNMRMWQNPAVQRNVKQLESDGHIVHATLSNGLEIATGELEKAPVIPPTTELINFLSARIQ